MDDPVYLQGREKWQQNAASNWFMGTFPEEYLPYNLFSHGHFLSSSMN